MSFNIYKDLKIYSFFKHSEKLKRQYYFCIFINYWDNF